INQCDEQEIGYDFISCTTGGQNYFADQCSSTCSGEDRGDNICRSTDFAAGCTAINECNGETQGFEYSKCNTGGESYFADECSWGCFGVDKDNICRSTDFAVGCTADSECNGIEAGTGICDSSCNYVSPNLIFNLTEQYQNNTITIFKFVINDTIGSSDNFTWQFNTGEGLGNSTFNSTYDIALENNESIFVYIAHDYISSGNYTITATAYTGGSSDSQNINVTII
ncbi:MAG: hypothetical protein ABIH25_03105, partial [Candidatus Woesearchaeota archaeon]